MELVKPYLSCVCVEIVVICDVCSRVAREGNQFAPKLGMLMSWNQKNILQRSKLRKSVLGLSPGECGFFSSETDHDRRKSPRPKFLFRGEDYRDKGHNPENMSWVRVPVKMIYLSQKLSTMEERRQHQRFLFRRGYYRNKGHNPENLPAFESRYRCFLYLGN
jgi:hypothetical protein